jgi:hypothetical protein
MREAAAGEGKIGTTGRGIGPAYEETRWPGAPSACRTSGTWAPLGPKVDRILVHHSALRRGLGQPEIDKDALMAELTAIAPRILPFMDVTWDSSTASAARENASCSRAPSGHSSMCTRHPSVRHLLEHRGGVGSHWRRRRPRRAELRARHRQGLHHPRGRRAVPDRTQRRHR